MVMKFALFVNCKEITRLVLMFFRLLARLGPLARDTVSGIVERAGKLAALPFPVHAHMLRHGTGYYLANRGTDTRTIQSYLGHSNIQHTVRYTELASNRFQGLWDG
jgi:site-specific recombinase XerD